MHELSIAYSLVQTAAHAAQAAGIEQVQVVHLQLGALSGVVKEALLFSYDIAVEGTVLAGSRLEIETLPVVIHCATCGDVQLPTIQRFRCPICDVASADIRQGKELEIVSLEYEETPVGVLA